MTNCAGGLEASKVRRLERKFKYRFRVDGRVLGSGRAEANWFVKRTGQEMTNAENLYTVLEPDLVSKVIIQHRASFLDDVIDRFADVWLGMAAREPAPPRDEPRPPEGGLLVWTWPLRLAITAWVI